MDRVGVLVVSKCLSSPAIVDALQRSERYAPEFFIVERQRNPFNVRRAKHHAVVPDLNLGDVSRFAARFKERISFGLTDTEDFVVAGGRDVVEREAGVPMVCVTKRFAVEQSKAGQRQLFSATFEEANPAFRVFDPRDYPNADDAVSELKKTVSGLGRPVVKPDAPARGAGVGVWGSDFKSMKEMSSFFLNLLSKGRVVVEERIEGEESSFHAFSDGKHFVPAPLTRDYKRALDGDRGRLTGGMGSYRGPANHLPFLRESDWTRLASSEESAFRRWKGRGTEPGLRGIVLYDAVMHTGKGFKILERNSRGGNTESVNLLATMADDFVDVCFRILSTSLKGLRFKPVSSVVTCAVPHAYMARQRPKGAGGIVELGPAEREASSAGWKARVLPMDVRLVGKTCRLGTSRSVAAVGVGGTLEQARDLSLMVSSALVGPLSWRKDIAAEADVERARRHLDALRSRG